MAIALEEAQAQGQAEEASRLRPRWPTLHRVAPCTMALHKKDESLSFGLSPPCANRAMLPARECQVVATKT